MGEHTTTTLTTPDGNKAEIDTELVPVITAIWDLGLDTVGSCQDLGESTTSAPRYSAYNRGRVLIEMPVEDALDLLTMVAADALMRTASTGPRRKHGSAGCPSR